MRPAAAIPSDALAPEAASACGPGRWFEVLCGADLGCSRAVEPWQLPEPYGTLLVHDGSMTARLEAAFDTRTTLDLVSVATQGDRYVRIVRLLDRDRRCLELGGVRLDLGRFDAALRRDIVRGAEPLGRLLSRHGLSYASLPRTFFAVDAPARLRDWLQLGDACPVFGRCTDLVAGARKLGDVVEVLPCYDAQRVPVPGPPCATW